VPIRLDLMRLANDFGRSWPASLSPISFHIFQASFDSSSTSLSLSLTAFLRQISLVFVKIQSCWWLVISDFRLKKKLILFPLVFIFNLDIKFEKLQISLKTTTQLLSFQITNCVNISLQTIKTY
jgi:hypothetical protein